MRTGARLRRCLAAAAAVLTGPVLAACGIANSPITLSFGSYTPITFAGKIASSNVDSSGLVSISCAAMAQSVTYALKLDGGSSTSVNARSMPRAGGGSSMGYNVYTDAARTVIWGDGTNGATFSGTVSAGGGTVEHTFYGRIPAGQSTVKPGTYSDQLVITLEYSP